MSGGAYNYASDKLDWEFIGNFVKNANTPNRKAFLKLILKVQKAMKEIEWVDSGDGGDEDAAIEACFLSLKESQVEAIREECDRLIEQVQKIKEGM